MAESNTVVSAYTVYRHLQQYCSHLSKKVNPHIVIELMGIIHMCNELVDACALTWFVQRY